MGRSLKIANCLLFLSLVVSIAFRPVVVWADQSSSKSQILVSNPSCPSFHAYLQKQAPASYFSYQVSPLKLVPKEETKEVGLVPPASKTKLPPNDALSRSAIGHSFQSFSPRNFLVLRI